MAVRTIAVRMCGVLLVVGLGAGCKRHVRLADQNVRSVEVGTVSHYGITLDKSATPEQVTFALLRAIREDFTAASAEDRERALDVQFDLCAADTLATLDNASIDRDEFIHEIVYRWTPAASHYVGDFETTWEKAEPRLVATPPRPAKGAVVDTMECRVLMQVEDPSGDANARVVLMVWLVQDKGYWRVLRVGFDPTRRSISPDTPKPREGNASAPPSGG